MANKSSNSNLTNAKNAKNDELYNDVVQNPQPGKGEPVKTINTIPVLLNQNQSPKYFKK